MLLSFESLLGKGRPNLQRSISLTMQSAKKLAGICVAALCLLSLPRGVAALSSEEVLVVVNSDSPQSVELGRFYIQQRGIDESRLVLLKTATAYAVSREDYNNQIHQPLRTILRERNLADKIRCLALMWGIPVRVEAPVAPTGPIPALYATEAQKSHYRLAMDHKLLATVGKKFPPPRTDGLSPVADLFEQPPPTVSEPLTDLRPLLTDMEKLLADKLQLYRDTPDNEQRQIMARQLMALHLDIFGLDGLRRFIEQARLTDAPDPNDISARILEVRSRLQATTAASQPTAESTAAILEGLRETGGLIAVAAVAKGYIDQNKPVDPEASVDSELALLWWDNYPLGGWMANPMLWNLRISEEARAARIPPVLMTARIDGPSAADARRIIEDSIETEKTGLKGKFYIDAGGLDRAKEYDVNFRSLYQFLRKATAVPVVFDDAAAMFAPGSCPDAALYVGWYSLQQYIPAFTWNRGAVGWHVASFEAMHLRDANSPEWCPRMIRAGVAATIGAVAEPRLFAFPVPQDFFSLLLTGKYTIAECYWRTVPNVSWRMTLIADPLYNPFKTNPQVSTDSLPKTLPPPQ